MSVEPVDLAGSDGLDLGARIALLAERAGVALNQPQLDQLVVYLTILKRWNTSINLTSLDVEMLPPPALERLVIGPIKASGLVASAPGTWFDLGSGCGSPALPFKVLRPRLHLVMVESRSRKVAFLREAGRLMGLSDVDVLQVRTDELMTRATPQSVDLVTIRAIRVDRDLVRVLDHILTSAGSVVLFGGDDRPLRTGGFVPVRVSGDTTVLSRNVPRGT